MTGATGTVENASVFMTGAKDGLRVINEVEQLAAFEYASCQTSHGIRQLLFGLQEGMSEQEAVHLLELEWTAALLSPDADERTASLARPSEPQ